MLIFYFQFERSSHDIALRFLLRQLYGIPKAIHLLQGRTGRGLAGLRKTGLDTSEPPFELAVSRDECLLRIDAEMLAQHRHAKEQIAVFLRDPVLPGGFRFLGEFACLLGDLVGDTGGVRPIESDPRRAFLQFLRPDQCGKREGDAVERAG